MEIIMKGTVSGMSQKGEMRLLYEPYNFEQIALKHFYGQHYKDRFKRIVIVNAYMKIRPEKKIEEAVKHATLYNLPESVLVKLMYKWFAKNEYAMNIRFSAKEGRMQELEDDKAHNIDNRETVTYDPNFVDVWADPNKRS